MGLVDINDPIRRLEELARVAWGLSSILEQFGLKPGLLKTRSWLNSFLITLLGFGLILIIY